MMILTVVHYAPGLRIGVTHASSIPAIPRLFTTPTSVYTSARTDAQTLSPVVRLPTLLPQSRRGGTWVHHVVGSDGRAAVVSGRAGTDEPRGVAGSLHLCRRGVPRGTEGGPRVQTRPRVAGAGPARGGVAGAAGVRDVRGRVDVTDKKR